MDRRGAVALANRVQQGVIDVYVSKQRTIVAARTFFTSIVKAHGCPEDITTDLGCTIAARRR
jgi:transposase-like protein